MKFLNGLNVTGPVVFNTPLPATGGGTGLSAFTLGDTLYSSAANTLSTLAGNITATRKALISLGTGSVSAAPIWDTIAGSDIASGNISVSVLPPADKLLLAERYG